MMIMLFIYTLVFSIIIFKSFYKIISFMKPFSVLKNAKSLATSTQIECLPFYINQGKINLFAFFINFFLLSLISLTLLPDLISNHIVFCQDFDDSDSSTNSDHDIYRRDFYRGLHNNNEFDYILKMIKKTYEISSTKRSYIYHSNYKYIGISDYQKVFQGFSEDFNDILNKQNILFMNEKFINLLSNNNNKNIDMKMYNKSYDLLSLNANAYKNIWFSYKNNNSDSLKYYLNDSDESYKLFNKMLNLNDKIIINEDISKNIRSFLGGYQYQTNKFNEEAIKFFNSLENVKETAKINLLQKGIILKDEKVIIKNPYELENYCNKKLILTLEKELNKGNSYNLGYQLEENRSFDIHMNINNKHGSFYLNQNNMNIIINKGFFLKEVLQSNIYYESFNRNGMDENMLEKYDKFIKEKEWLDELEADFHREVEEEEGF